MIYFYLILGFVGLATAFYIKYLRTDRELLKNDLDLYKGLHNMEVDHVKKLEKILTEEERKARYDYANSNATSADAVRKLREAIRARKANPVPGVGAPK